jgi:hypothetical protein
MVKHIGRNLKKVTNVDDWLVNGSSSLEQVQLDESPAKQEVPKASS